ncbi:MAG: hypothetical protein RL375_1003 [Pseudomonadota bacterium]|jgi:hypothetical protein
MSARIYLIAVSALLTLSACDQLGLESSTAVAARKEADGKAIGSACRQAMRAIEDCYTLNPKSQKAAIFAGWREMDEYMRENKLEGIVPVVPRKSAAPASAAADAEAEPAADSAADKARPQEHPAHNAQPGRLKATH